MKHNWKKSDHTFDDKVKLFCENILVINEDWSDDMNITDDAAFLAALIKCTKSRFNQK